MKTTSQSFIFLLFVCGVFGAETDEVKAVSVMEGDSVTLKPDLSEIHTYWQILWRFGNDLIAEIDGSSISYKDGPDGRFKGRLQLNSETASLTITSTRIKHSGSYKLEAISSSGTTYNKFSVTVYESPSVIEAGKVEVKPVSVIEGDPVTLQTDVTETHGDELIVWRFGDEGKLIAKSDMEAKNSTLYETDERFRDRLKLDQTGSLTITNIRTTDSERYTVKITSSKQTLQKKFIVTVSEKVKFVPVKKGDPVTLHTDTEIQRDDLILWMFGSESTPIAQINRAVNKISLYEDVLDGRFRGRLKLDQSGSLTITNTRTTDSGDYKAKISSSSRRVPKYTRFNVNVTDPGLSSSAIAGIVFAVLLVVFSAAAAAGVFYHRLTLERQKLKTVSVMEGESVTLNTDVTEIHRDDLIEWRFGETLIAEIKGGIIKIHDLVWRFRDRLKLDKKTGSLTITNTRTIDSGLYKLKISKDSKIKYKKKFSVSVCVEKVSVKEGESVTLDTDVTEIHRDDQIQWRFGDENSLIAEIKGGTISTYDDVADGRFRDRLKLDKKTGSLTITDTEMKHMGVYKLQIRSSSGDSNKKFRVKLRQENISVEEGEDFTLEPKTEIQKDDQILWMFGDQENLIAQIRGGKGETHDDVPDGRFRDRLKLDEKTGSLTITNMRIKRSGLYKLQIISSNRGTTNKRFVVTVSAERVFMLQEECVTLYTDDTEIHRDDLIQWRFGETLIAEIKGGISVIYDDVAEGRFKDSLELDTSGSLTITDPKLKHIGDYKLKIRSSSGDSYKKISVVIIPKISVNEGNDVTLNTDAEIQTDDLILWTFGAKNAVIAYMTGETRGKHYVTDWRFRDRLEVDEKTGSLIITKIRDEHTGVYQLQIITSTRGTTDKRFEVVLNSQYNYQTAQEGLSPGQYNYQTSLDGFSTGSDGKAPPPSPRSSPLKALKSAIPESTTVEVDTPLLSRVDEVNEQQETSSL